MYIHYKLSMNEALDKECTLISETILVKYKILCCWGMGFIKLVTSCEKCNTWHTELCTCTATRRYKLISEIPPRSVIMSEDRGSSTSKQLTYKLSEIQTNLSVCPITCGDVEGDNQRRCTIVMKYEVDIIKHFETCEKIITKQIL